MLNKTTIMGRLTADPELRTTQGGVSVASFSIACERDYKVGEKRPTDFFNCVAWRGQGEYICRNFHKGKPIILEGRFENRSYEDKSGDKRWVTELIVSQVYFAGDSSGKDKPPLPDAPPEHGKASIDVIAPGGDFSEMAADSDDLPF